MSGRKKRLWVIMAVLCCWINLAGCTVTDLKKGERQDLDFTVIKKEDVPEEIRETIEEKKEDPFQLTYMDKGELYIVKGYGKQKTSGYSVRVTGIYETDAAVHICTELEGPGEKEEVVKKNTYPYVTVKLEYDSEHVVFEE